MKFKQGKEKNRQVNLDVDLDEKDLEPYYKIGYKKLVKKILKLEFFAPKQL